MKSNQLVRGSLMVALTLPVAAAAANSTQAVLDGLLGNLISTAVYATVGLVFFGIAFLIFSKIMPFSVRKEIEEDQNTSLGVIIGAMLIGISIIIAAAIV